MANEPKRVLHVLQRMEAGGTQALLMNLYRNIERDKLQFDFLVMNPDKEFYDDEIQEMGGKIYYSTVRRDLNIIKFMLKLKRIFRDNPEYKVIHVHTYAVGFFCLLVARKMNVPVRIVHSHSNETVRDLKYYPKLILQRLYTKYATDRFACSDEAGKYLYKEKDFIVLNNAIDAKKFIYNDDIREKIRIKYNLKDNFVVGHVGRLHEAKNHFFLLEVFKVIKEQKKQSKLVLIGMGPREEEIRKYADNLGLKEDVLFLGNKNNVNQIIQSFDIFILPSLFEGLGIVAIEAQAAGVPILCSTGVPSEANVSPLFKSMELDEGAQKWAETAIVHSKNPCARSNMYNYIVQADYDLSKTVLFMQNYYIEKYNNI